MNEKQEMQWLYAKGLEFAMRVKGIPNPLPEMSIGVTFDDFIKKNYDDLAMKFVRKIVRFTPESIKQD